MITRLHYITTTIYTMVPPCRPKPPLCPPLPANPAGRTAEPRQKNKHNIKMIIMIIIVIIVIVIINTNTNNDNVHNNNKKKKNNNKKKMKKNSNNVNNNNNSNSNNTTNRAGQLSRWQQPVGHRRRGPRLRVQHLFSTLRILLSIGNFPEILNQRIVVGRLSVYIYIIGILGAPC